ncbi:tRNA (guanosine(46)-N7)-methyltransferase TrmB [uncultured Desulfosarcina sp.]|uniref:tRNA (guanosine(46)-N7)-methyltransferase TrmB n=1 Tax=uncultured Desulfosarcina sp. TaxID=218289 RepID=UPI0029C7DDC5|nr:tRNA (guanosine(46)-N7)-methyltransferase TrmB [uncultured Desulfosarcina sp.]
MPKNKLQKFERVRHLPNVILAEETTAPSLQAFPWNQPRYAGMQRVLELGCGKGEHSLAFAAASPQKLCVGVDYKSHRMCVGAEMALARGLGNVHFLRTRVERIRAFFPSHSIDEIWLTFPDPLWKNRKSMQRLTAGPFLDDYANLLVPGGSVHLKTDSRRFFQFSCESVQRRGGRVTAMSENLYDGGPDSPDPSEAVSAYERAALTRGAAICYLEFTLNSRHPDPSY